MAPIPERVPTTDVALQEEDDRRASMVVSARSVMRPSARTGVYYQVGFGWLRRTRRRAFVPVQRQRTVHINKYTKPYESSLISEDAKER